MALSPCWPCVLAGIWITFPGAITHLFLPDCFTFFSWDLQRLFPLFCSQLMQFLCALSQGDDSSFGLSHSPIYQFTFTSAHMLPFLPALGRPSVLKAWVWPATGTSLCTPHTLRESSQAVSSTILCHQTFPQTHSPSF